MAQGISLRLAPIIMDIEILTIRICTVKLSQQKIVKDYSHSCKMSGIIKNKLGRRNDGCGMDSIVDIN